MMKKLFAALLIAALALMGIAALAETVQPMDGAPDLNNGAYPASFKKDDLADGTLKGVHIYTMDRYSYDDIAKLAVGDTLYIAGKAVEIKALALEEDVILQINGGHDDGGYTLQKYESDPEIPGTENLDCWLIVGDNMAHSYTEHGVADCALDAEVTYTDASDIDAEPIKADGLDAVSAAIRDSYRSGYFEDDTTLTFQDGRIVAIKRDYTP